MTARLKPAYKGIADAGHQLHLLCSDSLLTEFLSATTAANDMRNRCLRYQSARCYYYADHIGTTDRQSAHPDKFFRRGQKCLIFAILCVPIRL